MSLTAQADFGLSLFREIAPNHTTTVFAPISIAFALSMVHLGARGTTREQIKNVFCGELSHDSCTMHFSSLAKKISLGKQMTVANRVFASNDIRFKKSYEDDLSSKLYANLQNLDFGKSAEAAEIVNNFVRTETKGKIDSVVSPKDFQGDTVAFAINAIYFNGKWATPFAKHSSREKNFHVNEDVVEKKMFMRKYKMMLPFFQDRDFKALSLPYKDSKYRLTIILPKEKFGLADVVSQLTGEILKKVITNENWIKVDIAIPKFKIDTEIEVQDALKNLGITEAFTRTADFTGMTGSSVRLGQAQHRTIMEVDEESTTVVAYTAMRWVNVSFFDFEEEKLVYFVADHPFLFVLSYMDNVLFIGQYFG